MQMNSKKIVSSASCIIFLAKEMTPYRSFPLRENSHTRKDLGIDRNVKNDSTKVEEKKDVCAIFLRSGLFPPFFPNARTPQEMTAIT